MILVGLDQSIRQTTRAEHARIVVASRGIDVVSSHWYSINGSSLIIAAVWQADVSTERPFFSSRVSPFALGVGNKKELRRMEAVSNINLQIRPARPHEEMFVDEASLGAQDGSEGNTY